MKYLKTYEQNNGITFKEWLKDNPRNINITGIDCSRSNLIDLNGIEQFKNLERLYCYSNKLTQLPDLSQFKNLKYLDCNNNKLTELSDLSQCENLEYLYCENNKLPYNNLKQYLEWHKKTYPWVWDAKKYNL